MTTHFFPSLFFPLNEKKKDRSADSRMKRNFLVMMMLMRNKRKLIKYFESIIIQRGSQRMCNAFDLSCIFFKYKVAHLKFNFVHYFNRNILPQTEKRCLLNKQLHVNCK